MTDCDPRVNITLPQVAFGHSVPSQQQKDKNMLGTAKDRVHLHTYLNWTNQFFLIWNYYFKLSKK